MPPTRTPRARGAGAVVVVGLALLAGCTLAEPSPTRAELTSPVAPSSTATAPTATAVPATATEVRENPRTVEALGGAMVLPLDGQAAVEIETTTHPAAERWAWTPSGAGDGQLALVAAPAGARFTVLGDRSVVVTDTAGVAVIGAAPMATGAVEVVDADLLRVQADPARPEAPVTLWLGETAVVDATWGHAEGGRSLAVEPTAWTRAADEAGVVLTWQHLEQVAPDDATPGMRDQLICHAVGARDKPTWNLEPWRPDVGLLAVLAARCNPT